MSAYIIRRKKHLNEAGEQPAVAAQAQPAAAPANAAPAQNAQQAPANAAPAQQPAAQQPAAAQPQAPQPATQPQQQNQQDTNQQQQQQQAPAAEENPIAAKVKEFIESTDAKIQANDIYWAITFNLPEALQAAVPEFKGDNPDAKNAVAAWEAFKKTPSKDTFQKFTTELTAFGSPATPEQATAQQAQQESVNLSFRDRLMENIEKHKMINKYARIMEAAYKN